MFGLTEEQEQLRREVRAFAEREVAPHVSRWDEASEFPHEVVKKLGAMGLLGVLVPESLGGAGMGYVEYVLAIEALSRVDGSVGIIVASHNSLCTNHIMLAGERCAAAEVGIEAGERRVAGGVGSDGAGERLGRGGCTDYGGTAWEWVGAERDEDVHYEWHLCGLCGSAGSDGSR